jgi:hypothetical protein
MIIEEVSPSRTELRLGFTTTFTQTEQTELFEFVQPSVPRVIAAGLVAGTVGVESADILDPSENNLLTLGQIQIQQFIDAVLNELQTRQPELFFNLSDLEPDAPENLSLTIEFLSSAIYEEFVSLLEVTRNTKQFDRVQESEMEVLIIRAVDNVLVNNNINLFTQNTVRYI